MDHKNAISNAVIKRLPRYYRILLMLQRLGVSQISSKDLSERMAITPSLVRSDFACFGGEGLKGNGYSVDILRDKIGEILGLEIQYNMVIVGAGVLAHTLVLNKDFEKKGFKIIGIFDHNPNLVGKKIGKYEVMDLDYLSRLKKRQSVDIAIITVSSLEAMEVIYKVIGFGIKGIWNFSPVEVNVPKDVIIENTYLSDILMRLGCNLNKTTIPK